MDKENKVIFLHIPKTGGTSIESCMPSTFSHEYRHYNLRRMGLSESDLEEYRVFSVIRDPMYRLVSTYHWYGFHERCHHYKDFESYVLNVERYFNGEFGMHDTRMCRVVDESGDVVLDQSHIEREEWWTETTDGKHVECDWLSFSDLNSEWLKYAPKIGISTPGELPWENVNLITRSDERNYMKHHTEKTKRIIRDIYSKELERLGY